MQKTTSMTAFSNINNLKFFFINFNIRIEHTKNGPLLKGNFPNSLALI